MRQGEKIDDNAAKNFNPRTLQESATAAVTVPLTRLIYFNPRTLQESATPSFANTRSVAAISIHAPYKRVRRSKNGPPCMALLLFQSTHPTRECDTNILGAKRGSLLLISIHAPYKRVRLNVIYIVCQPLLFQSTHPTRECDSGSDRVYLELLEISIHAPYKRVRLCLFSTKLWEIYFNPRTLQESATWRP